MKRFYIVLLTLVVTPLCAGVYGILHDQIAYALSPEYFHALRFNQFDIPDEMRDRVGVCLVGWKAAWWLGLPIGLGLGLAALIHSTWRSQWRYTVRSIGIALLITAGTGLLGLLNGEFTSDAQLIDWAPETVLDKRQYAAAAHMHSYSYIGGFLGLGAGIIYHIFARNKERKRQSSGRRR